MYFCTREASLSLPKLSHDTFNPNLDEAFDLYLEQAQGQMERIDRIVWHPVQAHQVRGDGRKGEEEKSSTRWRRALRATPRLSMWRGRQSTVGSAVDGTLAAMVTQFCHDGTLEL